ncbi:MAG: hypothetical protein FWG63_08195 [Defluviitaleaceae bacterium]|nr:hypothetical protein [Defluviitaleaceae bacterium]
MIKLNKSEEEVYAIRDRIYEEIKHMSKEQYAERLRSRGQKLAAEFGFTIVSSAGMQEAERDRK